jgi:hypothetical protein
VFDAGEKEVATHSPNQQPRKCRSLGMTLDIPISLGARQLSKPPFGWLVK